MSSLTPRSTGNPRRGGAKWKAEEPRFPPLCTRCAFARASNPRVGWSLLVPSHSAADSSCNYERDCPPAVSEKRSRRREPTEKEQVARQKKLPGNGESKETVERKRKGDSINTRQRENPLQVGLGTGADVWAVRTHERTYVRTYADTAVETEKPPLPPEAPTETEVSSTPARKGHFICHLVFPLPSTIRASTATSF